MNLRLPKQAAMVTLSAETRACLLWVRLGHSALSLDHGDAIKPCYGYRFEYGGRAAVLSSDTRYNQMSSTTAPTCWSMRSRARGRN
jgi:hypothetical protein